MNVGIIDAIQSIANAAFACLLESNGDVIVAFGLSDEYTKPEESAGLSLKKIMMRTMPNTISTKEIKASTYGNDLYPYDEHMLSSIQKSIHVCVMNL